MEEDARGDANRIVAAAAERPRPMRRDRRPRVAIVVETGLFREALARALPRYGLGIVDREADPDVVLVDVTGGANLGVLRELAAAE